MINLKMFQKEKRKWKNHNSTWSQSPDHQCRLIIGGWKNKFVRLIQ